MADLLLKIADGAGYADGDILCAFNRRAILCCHAQRLCHHSTAVRNGSGLILAHDLFRDWCEATSQFRFTRISPREVRRTVLATGHTDVLSNLPNAKGEYIDVRVYLRRRRLRNDHQVFGEDGSEVWYGGTRDFSSAAVAKVWDAIEAKRPLNRASFTSYRMGQQDIKSHLAISTDEFDDATATELVSPDVDETDPENPVIVAKRRNTIDWRNDLGLSLADIALADDRAAVFDLRSRGAFNRQDKVKRKPRPVTFLHGSPI